jgi:hypothetical protein
MSLEVALEVAGFGENHLPVMDEFSVLGAEC